MPRKSSTVVVLEAYPQLPSRRWIKATLLDVHRVGRDTIRFKMSILDEPQQAGRSITHDVPAILAPASPLSVFLADGFGLRLHENHPFDLTKLVGRVVEARFTKAIDGHAQTVAAVRPCEMPTENGAASTPTKTEGTGGLG